MCLGGKEREPGEVRGGAEGWEALRFRRSPPTGIRTCNGATKTPGPWQLPSPTKGWGMHCEVMLRSWEAGQSEKRRGDPKG